MTASLDGDVVLISEKVSDRFGDRQLSRKHNFQVTSSCGLVVRGSVTTATRIAGHDLNEAGQHCYPPICSSAKMGIPRDFVGAHGCGDFLRSVTYATPEFVKFC